MKKVFTIGLCAVAALSAFAYQNYDIPVTSIMPDQAKTTFITEEDGVFTINFTGDFADWRGRGQYTEYAIIPEPTSLIFLNGGNYNLEFDYQCDEEINDVNWLYRGANGTIQGWCKNYYKKVLPATTGDEWNHASLFLGDRILQNFGTGLGQSIRLHLRTINRIVRTENPDKTFTYPDTYGTPFTVKIKNMAYVPVEKETPSAIIPVEIASIEKEFKGDADYKEPALQKNENNEYTLYWEGNWAKVVDGKPDPTYVEYNIFTTPLAHPLFEGVDYQLSFDYKGPRINGPQVMFWQKKFDDGFIIGNTPGAPNSIQHNIPEIPAAADWTPVHIKLTDLGSQNNWGRFNESTIRFSFTDADYQTGGSKYGQPLKLNIRDIRFEPVNASFTEPTPIDFSFTAISGDETTEKSKQPDGSYDIHFTGYYPINGGPASPRTEYEAYTPLLTTDLPEDELYYISFYYQADDVINEFVGRYWQDGVEGGPIIGSTSTIELPATSEWTHKLLPLSNRKNCINGTWGKVGQKMRVHFYNRDRMELGEDQVPASRRNNKFGAPLNVKIKDFKLVPASRLVDAEITTPTGIENVAVDAFEGEAEFTGEPEYYNIQGQRIMNPEKGFYIVRRGNKVSKVILR